MRSDIFDQKNLEVATGQRFVLQNTKMLKVTLGEPVIAAKGAMVAYQGNVQFHHKGADSLTKFVKRAMSSDDQALMTVSGQGDVFFARMAENVFLIELEGDAISVGGSSLLAFDAALQWDLHRTRGAGTMTGGLFNTLIQGRGSVALTSDGTPVILDCSQQPTFVDPNAAVCWSANLVPDVVSSMNMTSLLRGGTGEAFQYKFHGPGFVVVQPSEGFSGAVQTS
ncbi:MAG: AIM24 family protein [Cellulomonas sp.]|uniref:AIM24 family protein n=1 Tax=Cellulomonas sp. TaxID=40001 RepID=UPI0019DCBD62|nr:AIM24 family protein [Cellulomonas sp.]MBF0689083.1 AIM24 family protein [Cellulomonas sp.]